MPLVVQFTRDGRPTGRHMTIPKSRALGRANDIHLDFDVGPKGGDVVAVYTKDGKEVAKHKAPKETRDIGIEFRDDTDDVSPGNTQIRDIHWTDKDGKRIGDYIGPPKEGANDIHVILPEGAKFTKAQWTVDGRPLGQKFDPPVDANDLHIVPDDTLSFVFQIPRETALSLIGGLQPTTSLAPVAPVTGEETATVRAVIGASFLEQTGIRAGAQAGLTVGTVLPGSAAEQGGLQPGDLLTAVDETGASEYAVLADCLGGMKQPTALALSVSRGGKRVHVMVTPEFCLFPFKCFGDGVKINKICDANCDCTIDQSGFLCATVWINVGDGPNGGVLLKKVCNSQEAGLPIFTRACGTKEFF